MPDENTCGHDACNCPSSDSGYCSDHCKNAHEQDIVEIRCDCGCPGCG
jgi:hypothetical protein